MNRLKKKSPLLVIVSCVILGWSCTRADDPADESNADECVWESAEDGIPSGGPYYHQIFRGTSTDGFSFEDESVLLLDHASVPDAIVGQDGKRSIYYINGMPGRHGIWIAREQSDGTFVTEDCVRIDGEFNANAVDPDVLWLPTGEMRLFYFEGNFVGSAGPMEEAHPFYAATSSDGIHFEVDGLALEVEEATDPSVVQLNDGTWLMAISQGSQTLFAASTLGLEYQLTGAVVEGGVPELALLDDGSLRCFVTGNGIESHRSTDNGATWTKESGTRLSGPTGQVTADPSLIKLSDGTFELYYKTMEPIE